MEILLQQFHLYFFLTCSQVHVCILLYNLSFVPVFHFEVLNITFFHLYVSLTDLMLQNFFLHLLVKLLMQIYFFLVFHLSFLLLFVDMVLTVFLYWVHHNNLKIFLLFLLKVLHLIHLFSLLLYLIKLLVSHFLQFRFSLILYINLHSLFLVFSELNFLFLQLKILLFQSFSNHT